MKAARIATWASVVAFVLLLVNHWVVAALVAHFQKAAGAPANFGVTLPRYVVFLVKLDHFAVDYGYVLLPLIWIVAFVGAGIIRLLAGVEPRGAAPS